MKAIFKNTKVILENYLYRNLFDRTSTENLSGYAINTASGKIEQSTNYGCSYKIPVSSQKDTHLTMSMLMTPNDESSRAVPSDASFFIAKYGFGDEFLGYGKQVTIDENVQYVRMQWWAAYGTLPTFALKLNYGQSF